MNLFSLNQCPSGWVKPSFVSINPSYPSKAYTISTITKPQLLFQVSSQIPIPRLLQIPFAGRHDLCDNLVEGEGRLFHRTAGLGRHETLDMDGTIMPEKIQEYDIGVVILGFIMEFYTGKNNYRFWLWGFMALPTGFSVVHLKIQQLKTSVGIRTKDVPGLSCRNQSVPSMAAFRSKICLGPFQKLMISGFPMDFK